MLISTWLTSVRSRIQSGSQMMKRRRTIRSEVRNAENLEIRSLLTNLVGVRPNVGAFYVDGDVRNVAPQELTLQFSLGDAIDASTVSNSSIQVVRAGNDGLRATADDVAVTLGFVGIGNVNNEVIVRFGENLPDDKYRIIIKGTGDDALKNRDGEAFNNGVDRTFLFELDLGAQIIAVNPQPVTVNSNGTVTQARNQIEVYFNNDDLNEASAETVSFYQLIDTKGTVSNLDDAMHNPVSVVYDAATDKAVLTFASSLDTLPSFGPGTYRLRIGNPYELPTASAPITTVPSADPGDSFATANKSLGSIGSAGTISRILSSAIDPQPYNIIFPGGPNDPGSREIERLVELAEQWHIGQHVNAGPDILNGTSQIDFNFKSIYGSDPLGNPLRNVITEAQKERAREVFELFSYYLGIDFRETESSGLTIATGDLRALDATVQTGRGGVFGLAVKERQLAIMDQAENWSDLAGGNWFQVAMHEIGHLIGLGDAFDQPAFTVMGSGENGDFPNPAQVEPDFPGDIDIVHGQYLHRPDSIDIDLYEFTLSDNQANRLTTYQVSTEVLAERLRNSSALDSYLRIYQKNANGTFSLLAQNDDYFSDDSFLNLTLEEGTYYIGVSSTGNETYDPTISGTGFGGTSQGRYEVRLVVDPIIAINDNGGVRSEVITTIVDSTGRKLDGDSDGEAGGNYDFWFQATTAANTLFVNKAFTGTGNGSAATPYRNVKDALAAAATLATGANTVIVRLVGNGGTDGDLSTVTDTRPYQIGFNSNGTALEDGSTFDVPRGTTVMIDGGAVLKLNRALISAGSSSAGVDRSGGSLQVLGTPDHTVMFTSWLDNTIGTNTANSTTPVDAGNWGGLVFRNSADRAQGRFAWQNEGIFLNYVAHADIRYGGGTVRVDSVNQIINPITIDGEQPTIVHNRITDSDDSAMAASPNSFEELTFHSPRFQVGTAAFTSSYGRVGPEIYGNTLVKNSTNGLFVQVTTSPGALPRKMTVPGRFDDTDIVHVVAQNLEIQGTPGGRVLDSTPPSSAIITRTPGTNGTLAAGTYTYILVMTDENGLEGVASAATVPVTVQASGSVMLGQLPAATGAYTGRRLYRSALGGGGTYTLIAKLDRSATTYEDRGVNLNRTLDPNSLTPRDRARTNGSLVIDPGTIVKLEGARIEAEFGAQLIAEGTAGRPIIFTSRLDDSYGAGGTFDTNFDDGLGTDSSTVTNEAIAAAGNWGGLYVGHTGTLSIDHALITFGGGVIPVGSNFGGFNAVEVHQADARISNSVFQFNGNGIGGTSTIDRSGLFPNREGTIFVRGAQPVILNNDFRNNGSVSISINANALNSRLLADPGRSTGRAEIQPSWTDNQGPLVRNNRFGGNTINGMQVRGETLTTQSVWDDTDIVHVLLNEVIVPNFEHFGGLRLESSSTASLVVKLRGANAGITAGGYALDLDDRIGGSLQIIGQPGFPVVLTSLTDDSVGAGLDLTLRPLRDTDNDGIRPQAQVVVGDWRGISIRQFAHDRNVKVHVENEIADANSPDTNGTVTAIFANSENVGLLAPEGHAGDENLRLGFEVHGAIDSPTDVDTYTFSATAGTGVWFDIDRASQSLDTVVELLDGDGVVVAVADGDGPVSDSPVIPGLTVHKLQYGAVQAQVQDQTVSKDLYTFSALDAGFRILLPGTVGSQQTYFVRVRSRNATAVSARTVNGSTTGVYQLQIRKQETDEVPGSQITYGDVRYAATGISITGQPTHSPVVGEAAESDSATGVSNVVVGNLMNSDRAALYLAGRLEAPTGFNRENAAAYDVDFWEFQVVHDKAPILGGVSVGNTHVPVTIDLDFSDGFSRANVTAAVYDSAGRLILLGRDSNIADDQPRPLNGADVSDLTRGSNGKLDPFIGPVELLPGTYRLAIFPNDIAPQALDQYWELNPTSSLVRLEPINSVRRIAEERFADELFSTRSTGSLPVVDLFTTTGGALDPKHTVPFNLGDVTLFVSTRGGTKGTDETTIRTVDALTGRVETTLGSFGPSIGDIAMRADGQLHAFTTNAAGDTPETDGTVGNYLRINSGTAEITNLGDDGIITNLGTVTVTPGTTPGDPPTISTAVSAHNVGIQFNAMTYTGTLGSTLYAIGRRSTTTVPPAPSTATLESDYNRNILYNFSAQTGAVDGNGDDRTSDVPLGLAATQGAGTTQREIGQVNTSVAGGLGGDITGMAFLNGQFYVIDHLGGLYRVNPGNAATTFIGRVATPNPGDSFSGLSLGPDEAEGGRFASTLFAVTNNGILHAVSTTGVAQPIFANGQSSIQIASVGSVTGLAFSTLDYNLWQITQNRGGVEKINDGHGIDVGTFDDSVLQPGAAQTGGSSLYFGNLRGGHTAGNQNTNLANNESISANPNGSTDHRNVNFPGGAHGSVISNTFSLDGYSAADKPALYFNYFLDTENIDYLSTTSPETLMRDSFRVYVADASGAWNLLVTNDSTRDNLLFDEFDLGPGPIGTETLNPRTQDFPDVVEAFDNYEDTASERSGWRQARVDLSNYAGRSDLKLRFVFSTAGEVNLGDINTTGIELFAVSGAELNDGDYVTVGGQIFEFDLGAHLTVPSGSLLQGKTISVSGTTFTLTQSPRPGILTDIAVLSSHSPSQAASAIASALASYAFPVGVPVISAVATNNRVSIKGATSLAAAAPIAVSGASGVTAGNLPITVTSDMTANQVAVEIRRSLAGQFGAGDFRNIRGYENLIQVIGRTVSNRDASGNLTSPLGMADVLPGERLQDGRSVGAFFASYVDGEPARPGSLRGMNNDVEGVYVDDIIIGFAERGEMVTNAPVSTTFILNDDLYNPDYLFRGFYNAEHTGIAEGAYDVEIRRATDLGETQEHVLPHQILYRTIDTNDREVQGTSFTISNADRIADGATFELSDGWNKLTFQFVDTANGNQLASSGNVAILFDSRDTVNGSLTDTAELMGALVVNAINSQTAQDVLRIQATFASGIDGDPDARIHLFGNASLTLSPSLQNIFGRRVYYQSQAPLVSYPFDRLYTPELAGDQNRLRDQGQIIVQSTIVRNSLNYGVDVDSSVRRDATDNGNSNVNNNPTLHPGAPKNTQENNDQRLTTGVVIANSLIVRNLNQAAPAAAEDFGGIRFRGDTGTSTVPYGRLVNNTIVGAGGGTGIRVADNASPTIINNIVADFNTGIFVDQPSVALGTTIAATLYRGNPTPASAGSLGLGTFPLVLGNNDALFVDQSVGNYYPAPLSQAVDSALNSLGDRDTLIRVRNSLGIGISPIIAPDLDVYGQQRGDDEDVSTPAAQGANVFLDRGAIDRVDFFAPIGRIQVPEDQSSLDIDPAFNSVSVIQRDFRRIRIRLNDEGVGIDDGNIRSSQFTLFANGVPLVENDDNGGYIFSYNDVTNEVTFDAVTVFEFETTYEIRVDNDGVDDSGDDVTGVRDSAGNFLRDNQTDGTTRFFVTAAVGANNPPTIDPISNLTIQEDSGARTVSLSNISAGGESQPITVTATSSNPAVIPHPTVTYPSAVAGSGILTFTPVSNAFGSATITVRVEDGGFDGNMATTSDNKFTTRTFVVTVTPVNDVPSLAVLSNVTIPEDSAQQTINLTGITAGPLESQPLRVTATSSNTAVIPTPAVTYTSPQSIGSLRFTPPANAVGTSTITVTVEDGGLDNNLSTTADNAKFVRTFQVTLTQVNDNPVANSGNYTVDEGYSFTLDAGPSSDVDEATGDVLSYAWDLNGDGTFETSTGTTTTRVVTWAQLTALGYTAPSVRNITLRVTDSSARTSLKTVTLSTLTVDYGDAPDSYGTLQASNGAAHTIGSLFLGSSVDKELTGQPGVAATGDGADENGVVFNSTLEVSPTLNLPSIMTVTASAAGKLDVWLDRNNNGVFEPGEHLNGGVSYNVVAGANRIQYILPAGTTTGDRFMRFRLSSSGSLAPTGRATSGEVEDYKVNIRTLQAPVQPNILKPAGAAIPETSDLTPLIEWSSHAPNFFYNLEIRNAANAVVFTRTGLTETSISVGPNNLPAGVYTIRLTALNRANAAAAVRVSQFRVVPLAIQSPIGDVTTSNPTIQWNPVAGTTRYFLEIQSATTGEIIQSPVIVVSAVTPPNLPNRYTVPVQLPLGQYRVRVRAADAAGLAGDFSPFTALNIRTAPTVVGPTGVITSLRPTITWSPVTGAATYRVELFNLTDNVNAVAAVSGITTNSWTPPIDLRLAKYRAIVTAFSATNFSGVASDPFIFTVTPSTTAISPIGALPDSTPTFGWTPIPGAERYELIVRNNRFDNNNIVINQTSLTTTSFTQPTNLPLGRYTYQIRGINNAALASETAVVSPLSAVFEFSITTAPVITQPQLTTFLTRPLFTWNNPLGAEKSDLLVQVVTSSGNQTFLTQNGIAGTSYLSTKDFGIGTYVAMVRTYSNTNNPATPADERVPSEWSQPQTFRVTTPPVLIGPNGPTADSTPTLTWRAVLGAQSYEVAINSDTFGIVDVVKVSGLNALNYTVTTALPIGRYSYRVRAASSTGITSDFSAPGRFEIVTPPAFVNPFTSTFDTTPTLNWTSLRGTLKGNPAGASTYEVVLFEVNAATGRYVERLRRTGLLTETFTVPSALPNGSYRAFVRATTAGLAGSTNPATLSQFGGPMDFYVGGRPVVNPIGTITDTTPTITWNPVQGATRYNLRVTTGNSPTTGPVVTAGSIPGLAYTVTTPLQKGTYRVWVQAISTADGTLSPWSLAVVMTIADASAVQNSGNDGQTAHALTDTRSEQVLFTSDSAVSMLPAIVVTATSDVQPAPTAEQPLQVTQPENAPVDSTMDPVLSVWDQQIWWESASSPQIVAAVTAAEETAVSSASTGILGTLLALAPAAVRRRLRKHQQKSKLAES